MSENTLVTNKQFEIIESEKDRNILSEIGTFQKDFIQPITDIQVNKLVLNDIEFPTDYAKIKQIKIELIMRYHSILESYYTIRKKELEIKLLNEEIENESHPIKKEMKVLDNEKATLSLITEKTKLNVIVTELRIYYKYYLKYNKGFENLNDEQKDKLEVDLWSEKALNNPILFEERYGEFLKDILGDKNYSIYLNRRKQTIGNFPRELVHDL